MEIDFVTKSVLDLLDKGLFEERNEKPFIISPLSVSVHNGKLRLILDLSEANSFIKSESFCLDDQNVFYDMCQDCKWAITFDRNHRVARTKFILDL